MFHVEHSSLVSIVFGLPLHPQHVIRVRTAATTPAMRRQVAQLAVAVANDVPMPMPEQPPQQIADPTHHSPVTPHGLVPSSISTNGWVSAVLSTPS